MFNENYTVEITVPVPLLEDLERSYHAQRLFARGQSEVCGLQTRAGQELNGKIGEVLDHNPYEQGEVRVKAMIADHVWNILPCNLRRVHQ